MSKTITNLTLPLVVKELESILDSDHYHSYRNAFAIPELRERLVANVLNRIPACYAMIEDNYNMESNDTIVPSTLRMQLQIAVVEEIEHTVEENADWVNRHIPQETNSGFAPSDWFG